MCYNFALLQLQLQTLDLGTGAVEELPQHLTQGLPMPNGATNWPGTDDTFVLLTQVKHSHKYCTVHL